MPIVFVHGVAVRDQSWWKEMRAMLARYVAPVISADPASVPITSAFWGDTAAKFAWDGASRPRSALLGQGAGDELTAGATLTMAAELEQSMPGVLPDPPPSPTPTSGTDGGLVPAGFGAPSSTPPGARRLRDLEPDELSDFASSVIDGLELLPEDREVAKAAADDVARDSNTHTQLVGAADEAEMLISLVEARLSKVPTSAADKSEVIGMGFGSWLGKFRDRVSEATSRATGVGGFVAGRLLGEIREPINDRITEFLGDVFVYLNFRSSKDGQGGSIPQRVLQALRDAAVARRNRSDEPVVVVSHSMGGQIIYDLVTHFIPMQTDAADLRIDFWCATASQVGLFEEMKLFLASSSNYSRARGNKVPLPDRRYLGGWWNVWDYNDFISYTAAPIFEGIDDEPYNSGMSLLRAHSGYLQRPSFHLRLAKKLSEAKQKNWFKP